MQRETASDFHCLLYLSFLMAGRALREIKDSYAQIKLSRKCPAECTDAIVDFKMAIGAAELSVRFLVCMLSSSAFKLHLRVWTNEELSLIAPPVTDCFKIAKTALPFAEVFIMPL